MIELDFKNKVLEGLINSVVEEVNGYIYNNRVREEDVKVYIHPLVQEFLAREVYMMYSFASAPKSFNSIMGVEVVDGYEVDVVIACPKMNFINPVRVKLKIVKDEKVIQDNP